MKGKLTTEPIPTPDENNEIKLNMSSEAVILGAEMVMVKSENGEEGVIPVMSVIGMRGGILIDRVFKFLEEGTIFEIDTEKFNWVTRINGTRIHMFEKTDRIASILSI